MSIDMMTNTTPFEVWAKEKEMSEKVELLQKLMALEAAEPIVKISAPTDILTLLIDYAEKQQEHFIAVTLNGAHEVIRVLTISIGILNRAIVHPREIFRPAILDNSASIIIAHNHPSGNTEPSKEDRDITFRLKEAGELLGIEVLDHVIITKKGYFSFLEEGEM